MKKHPDCEDRCQLLEHKGYQTCAVTGKCDFLHTDESPADYTDEQQAFIDHRTQELLSERLNDRDRFHDLLSGIPREEIEPHLFRALANLDLALCGEHVGREAIFTALSLIQRRLKMESQIVWADECRAEAKQQLKREVA